MLCIRTNLHVITIFVSIVVCLMLDFANSKGRQEVMCALQNIKFNNNICAPIFLCLVPLNTTINLYMQEPYRKCVVIFCQAAVLVDVLYCLVDRNRNAPGVDPQVYTNIAVFKLQLYIISMQLIIIAAFSMCMEANVKFTTHSHTVIIVVENQLLLLLLIFVQLTGFQVV